MHRRSALSVQFNEKKKINKLFNVLTLVFLYKKKIGYSAFYFILLSRKMQFNVHTQMNRQLFVVVESFEINCIERNECSL